MQKGPACQQTGSAQLFVLLTIILVVFGGFVILKNFPSKQDIKSPAGNIVNNSTLETYTNKNLGIEVKYNKDLKVTEDTEEAFNKRGNGNFRKNFNGYIGYEPGKFLGAVVVLDKTNSYEINPFTVWVFENADNLTIDNWHHKFWYFPFVWGDFTATGKYELAPEKEATVSGMIGKSRVIDYREGKPKFVYLSKDQKMYLFRIVGNSGEKILESFKFI